jgi:hypothetical protein
MTPLLHGGDPAPGDPVAVRRLVRQLRSTVDSVADATTRLRAVGSDASVWTGRAADAFTHKRVELLRRLNTAHAAYESAADGLDGWVRRLELAQSEAASIVSRAQAVAQQAQLPPNAVPLVGVPAPLLALQKARDALEARARREAAACAGGLHEAIRDLAPFQHTGWQHFTEQVLAASHVLHEVNKWLGVAMLALQFVPVVGEVGDIVLLATGALMLGADLYLVHEKKATWGNVAGDVAGLALFGAGRAGEAMFRSARQAEQFTVAARGAGRLARELDSAGAPAAAAVVGRDAADAALLARNVGARTGLGPSVVAAARDLVGAARPEADVLATAARDASWYGSVPGLLQWSPALRAPGAAGAVMVAADTVDAATLGALDDEVRTLVDKALGEDASTCPVP